MNIKFILKGDSDWNMIIKLYFIFKIKKFNRSEFKFVKKQDNIIYSENKFNSLNQRSNIKFNKFLMIYFNLLMMRFNTVLLS